MPAISRGRIASRLASGAFILHSGIDKWKASEEAAAGLHGFASTAYPALGKLEPDRFARLLAVGEMATGAALLVPIVPNRLAGAALTGFAGALVGLYFKVPGLRRPGSIWPTEQGTAVAKDVWLLGFGIDLLTDKWR